MGMSTINEIERAIENLTPEQLTELYTWLDQNFPQLIDTRLPQDLAAGRLDAAIQRALSDERNGTVRPL